MDEEEQQLQARMGIRIGLCRPQADYVTTHSLVALFDLAFVTARVPERWRAGEIVALPKKGDRTLVENHRGITIMCHVSKRMCRVSNRERGLLQ